MPVIQARRTCILNKRTLYTNGDNIYSRKNNYPIHNFICDESTQEEIYSTDTSFYRL